MQSLPIYQIKKVGKISTKATKVTTSIIANDIIRECLDDTESVFESVYALFLDSANNVIGVSKIATGGTGCVTGVDAKLIFKTALDCLACSIILSHNHPSGKTDPSRADIQLTKKLQDGAKLLNMRVLDHIITEPCGTYYSFGDSGIL